MTDCHVRKDADVVKDLPDKTAIQPLWELYTSSCNAWLINTKLYDVIVHSITYCADVPNLNLATQALRDLPQYMDGTTSFLQSISINGLLMAAGQHPKTLSRCEASVGGNYSCHRHMC